MRDALDGAWLSGAIAFIRTNVSDRSLGVGIRDHDAHVAIRPRSAKGLRDRRENLAMNGVESAAREVDDPPISVDDDEHARFEADQLGDLAEVLPERVGLGLASPPDAPVAGMQRRDRAEAQDAERGLRSSPESRSVVGIYAPYADDEIAGEDLLRDQNRRAEGRSARHYHRLATTVAAHAAVANQVGTDLLDDRLRSGGCVGSGPDHDRDVPLRDARLRELAHKQRQHLGSRRRSVQVIDDDQRPHRG